MIISHIDRIISHIDMIISHIDRIISHIDLIISHIDMIISHIDMILSMTYKLVNKSPITQLCMVLQADNLVAPAGATLLRYHLFIKPIFNH